VPETRITVTWPDIAAAGPAAALNPVALAAGWSYPQIGAMPLPDLRELQVRAKAEQSRSFQEYLRRQGKTEVIDGSWPLKTWTEAAA
jgi:DNA polymerase III subunit epsilon